VTIHEQISDDRPQLGVSDVYSHVSDRLLAAEIRMEEEWRKKDRVENTLRERNRNNEPSKSVVSSQGQTCNSAGVQFLRKGGM
jgi:hypothetical protein